MIANAWQDEYIYEIKEIDSHEITSEMVRNFVFTPKEDWVAIL